MFEHKKSPPPSHHTVQYVAYRNPHKPIARQSAKSCTCNEYDEELLSLEQAGIHSSSIVVPVC